MQEFFMDYGLWLLIGLLVVIGVVFLLGGRGKSADAAPEERSTAIEREVSPTIPAEPSPAVAPAPVASTPAQTPAPDFAPAAAPLVEPAPLSPTAATSTTEQGDNLLKLKGVGPKLNLLLIELGVTRYAQIAQWSDADIAAIDARLGSFKGRPVRDQWVDQARYLAAGDIAGFEAKYGKV